MATKTSSKEKSRWGQDIVVQAVWDSFVKLNPKTLAEVLGFRAPARAKDLDFARIRRGQPLADFDRSRFPRTVRPKKAEALAESYLKIESIDCDDVLVRLAEIADAKGGFRRGFGHGPSIASDLCRFKT